MISQTFWLFWVDWLNVECLECVRWLVRWIPPIIESFSTHGEVELGCDKMAN
jgi:hypothetical protein